VTAGRKTKLTPKLVKQILELVALGGTDKDAYTVAGISHDTFYEWMKQSEFSEQVTSARAKGKLLRIGRIKKHGEKDWRADAWYLERRWPEEYAQQLIVKVSPDDLALLRQMGFKTPADAWAALMDNARKEYADAQSDS
jgi:hypothetical protein